jgi:hypothetical protein
MSRKYSSNSNRSAMLGMNPTELVSIAESVRDEIHLKKLQECLPRDLKECLCKLGNKQDIAYIVEITKFGVYGTDGVERPVEISLEFQVQIEGTKLDFEFWFRYCKQGKLLIYKPDLKNQIKSIPI